MQINFMMDMFKDAADLLGMLGATPKLEEWPLANSYHQALANKLARVNYFREISWFVRESMSFFSTPGSTAPKVLTGESR